MSVRLFEPNPIAIVQRVDRWLYEILQIRLYGRFAIRTELVADGLEMVQSRYEQGGRGSTFSEKLRTSACWGMAIKSLRERRRSRKCESHYRDGDPLVRNLASPRLRKPWYLFRSTDPIHWNPRNSSYRQIEGFSTVSMENRIFRMGYFKRGDLFVLLYWGISKKIFVVEECIIWM